MRVTDEYIVHQFEKQLRNRLTEVSSQMCALTQHDIKHRELSPFQSHSIIKRRGEIIVELQCQPVTVQSVLGERRDEKCSKDALPVYLNWEPVYLTSKTRLVSDKNLMPVTGSSHTGLSSRRRGRPAHGEPRRDLG